MAWIKSILVVAACVAFSNGLSISEFKSVGGPIYDAWAAASADNVRADGSESFGLAFAGGKVYVVSRRGADASAVQGGIVSILDRATGNWSHKSYDALDTDASRKDHLLSLAGRLYMLVSSSSDAIRFHKLFVFDDEQGKWNEIKLDVDPLSSEPLIRSKDKFISINVPDQDGSVAFIGATDHDMDRNNSGSALSQLKVNLDPSGKPLDASLKRIIHLEMPLASAIIATAAKDDKLYLMVSHFTADSKSSNVSLDKVIDLKTQQEMSPAPVLSGSPVVDFNWERVVQLKDKVLFLGPHTIEGDKQKRHIWSLDLATLKLDEADAVFPNVPNRVFAYDHKNMEMFAAGLKAGVFAANIMDDMQRRV